MSDPEVSLAPLTCTYTLADGSICNKPKDARGYCNTHYQVMKRAGAFTDLKPIAPKSSTATVRNNVRALQRAERKLARLAPTFVDHLLRASEVAAENGKGDPAQWALIHSRAVTPIATNTNTNSQPVINIGVKVSGVKGE